MVWDRKPSRDSGHFWLYLRTAGLSSWQAALANFFHKSLPLNKLHYCLHGGSTPLIICQGASSSKGIDKEFGGLGQEAIQRFWTFLAVPENSGAFFLAGCPGQFFHKSLPLNKLHYCLHGGSTPLIICQGASSSKGIDKEFGGLGQEAIQRFWTFLAVPENSGAFFLAGCPGQFFHKSLPLNKLHYCLHGGSTPLIICQGASSSKGIDKEFGGLGQEAIQRFWTFLAVPENSGAFFLAGCPGQFFSQIPTLKQAALLPSWGFHPLDNLSGCIF